MTTQSKFVRNTANRKEFSQGEYLHDDVATESIRGSVKKAVITSCF